MTKTPMLKTKNAIADAIEYIQLNMESSGETSNGEKALIRSLDEALMYLDKLA